MTTRKRTWIAVGSLFSFSAFAAQPDFSKHFSNKNGCFVLYDLKAKKLVTKFNEERCGERFVACSTFKVPLAVMAFDKGTLKDETTTLKWDGKNHPIESWNHDQTAASWIQNSVVWFSQQLTPALGLAAVKDYLKKFEYGTQDMSSGLTTAWLTSGPTPTLKISADEQVRFLERLWNNSLPVSRRAQELTKKLIYLETSPSGAVLHGKTGSTNPTETVMGWFVGHLKNGDHEYIFALNFTGPTPKTGPRFAGMTAKTMTKAILSEMGLF